MTGRTNAGVLALGERLRYESHEFVGVVFLASPQPVVFYGCSFENCDLSAVTRVTITDSTFKNCVLPPMRYLEFPA